VAHLPHPARHGARVVLVDVAKARLIDEMVAAIVRTKTDDLLRQAEQRNS
jgi:hypothetical protein